MTNWAFTLTEPIRVIVDSGPSAPWYEKTEFWAVLVPLLVALLAAWRAKREWFTRRDAERRDGLAAEYARALADAIAWTELPYRVARRTSDSSETLAGIVAKFHDLQERLEHNLRWLQLDSEAVGAAYEELVRSVKRKTEDDIRSAWERDPITTGRGMNIGAISKVDVSAETDLYLAAVRTRLEKLDPPRRDQRKP